MDLPRSPIELLTTTRTVRRRLDFQRPVDIRLIGRALDIAAQAPMGGLQPRAHFLVITQESTRTALGEIYRTCWEARYGTTLSVLSESGTVRPDIASAAYLAEHLGQVPVLVVACAETGDALPEGNQASLWGSVLPATWNYMLAARAQGLAAAWTTVILDAETQVAELLGLPASVRIGALLPTAHPLGEGFRPAHREHWSTHVHLDRWGTYLEGDQEEMGRAK